MTDPALGTKAAPTTLPARRVDPRSTQAAAPVAKSAASPFSKWIAPRSNEQRPAPSQPASSPPPSLEETRLKSVPTPQATAAPDRTAEGPVFMAPGGRETVAQPEAEQPRLEIARRTLPRSRSRNSNNRSVGEILNPDAITREESQSPAAESTEFPSRDARELEEIESNATPLSELLPKVGEPKTEPTTEPEVEVQLPPLTKSQLALRSHVRRVLKHYYDHPMNTRDRSPWELIHAALSYEIHSRVLQGGPDGKPVSAVGWLCFNQPCRKMKLMYVNDEGDLQVRVGPALQGHRGQLLAILAQSKVSSEYPMLVDGHEMKVKNLVRDEMATCYPRTELTFKLIGLMYYLDSNTQWVNDQGMAWDLRKLVSEEIRQPIRGAACGGTHRLSGLTLAYKTRQQRGEPVDGVYQQAQRFVAQHQLYAYRMQNPDGSFSTNWFQGRENKDDIDRKLKTTGHILEWLLYSATDRELKSPRTARAVYYLANLMYTNRYRDWEAGPLGHSLHALMLYDRMMFSQYDEPSNVPVAIRDSLTSSSPRSR